MLPDRGWNSDGLKHSSERITAAMTHTHVCCHGRPHIAAQLQRSTKLKRSHTDFLESVFSPLVYSLECFALYFILTHYLIIFGVYQWYTGHFPITRHVSCMMMM